MRYRVGRREVSIDELSSFEKVGGRRAPEMTELGIELDEFGRRFDLVADAVARLALWHALIPRQT
jgi:hypothetical protein